MLAIRTVMVRVAAAPGLRGRDGSAPDPLAPGPSLKRRLCQAQRRLVSASCATCPQTCPAQLWVTPITSSDQGVPPNQERYVPPGK